MYPLSKQVDLACHQAKMAAAVLMGSPPTQFEECEPTIDGMKAHIAKALKFLQSIKESEFEGAENREIKLPLVDDLVLEMATGHQFLRDWALPHFYFHVVTAYDILRNNGVEIGKRDYLAHIAGSIQRHPHKAS